MLGLYSAAAAHGCSRCANGTLRPKRAGATPDLSQRIDFRAEKRYVTVTVAPVTMSDEYLGSVSVFRDITAEVEADRAKTEFISTVSHDCARP